MNPTHLLDTSVYCQPLKPIPSTSVQNRWNSLGNERLAISIICEAELLFGLELKQSSKLTAAFEHTLKNRLRCLPVDGTVAITYSQMKALARRKGHVCSDFDFLIAATAKAHNLILATLNFRHFNGIEGLAVEDWS